MISIVAFIFVFGILVFIHELGHFLLAKRNKVLVEKFSFGFGRKIWGRKIGQTEYLISAIPLGGYIKMAGDEPAKERKGLPWEFLSKSCGQRAQIVAAGPILNYLLAFVLFSFIFIIGSPTITTRVGKVMDGYPAKEAGIKEGDMVLAVDGEQVEYWQDMAEIIYQKTTAEEVVIDIERNGEIFKIKLRPRIQERKDIFGQKTEIALIGIQPSGETAEVRYGWGRAFYEGGKKLLVLTGFTYKALWFVSIRRLSFRESFAGPILIFKLTGSAARMGFVYLLNLMGLLSMSLAIFNFLPLPVLDGGHLFFFLLEKIRKRPLNPRTQEIITQTGMLILITFLVFVSYYDILRSGWLDKAIDFWGKMGPK